MDDSGEGIPSDSKTDEPLAPTSFTTLPVVHQACLAMPSSPQSPLENIVKVRLMLQFVCVIPAWGPTEHWFILSVIVIMML